MLKPNRLTYLEGAEIPSIVAEAEKAVADLKQVLETAFGGGEDVANILQSTRDFCETDMLSYLKRNKGATRAEILGKAQEYIKDALNRWINSEQAVRAKRIAKLAEGTPRVVRIKDMPKGSIGFGGKTYAFGELIPELGDAFVFKYEGNYYYSFHRLATTVEDAQKYALSGNPEEAAKTLERLAKGELKITPEGTLYMAREGADVARTVPRPLAPPKSVKPVVLPQDVEGVTQVRGGPRAPQPVTIKGLTPGTLDLGAGQFLPLNTPIPDIGEMFILKDPKTGLYYLSDHRIAKDFESAEKFLIGDAKQVADTIKRAQRGELLFDEAGHFIPQLSQAPAMPKPPVPETPAGVTKLAQAVEEENGLLKLVQNGKEVPVKELQKFGWQLRTEKGVSFLAKGKTILNRGGRILKVAGGVVGKILIPVQIAVTIYDIYQGLSDASDLQERVREKNRRSGYTPLSDSLPFASEQDVLNEGIEGEIVGNIIRGQGEQKDIENVENAKDLFTKVKEYMIYAKDTANACLTLSPSLGSALPSAKGWGALDYLNPATYSEVAVSAVSNIGEREKDIATIRFRADQISKYIAELKQIPRGPEHEGMVTQALAALEEALKLANDTVKSNERATEERVEGVLGVANAGQGMAEGRMKKKASAPSDSDRREKAPRKKWQRNLYTTTEDTEHLPH